MATLKYSTAGYHASVSTIISNSSTHPVIFNSLTLKILCMKGFYSSAIMSCTKLSKLMKPLGDRSVLEDRLSKKFITVSPMFALLISCRRSCFLAVALFWSFWYFYYTYLEIQSLPVTSAIEIRADHSILCMGNHSWFHPAFLGHSLAYWSPGLVVKGRKRIMMLVSDIQLLITSFQY